MCAANSSNVLNTGQAGVGRIVPNLVNLLCLTIPQMNITQPSTYRLCGRILHKLSLLISLPVRPAQVLEVCGPECSDLGFRPSWPVRAMCCWDTSSPTPALRDIGLHVSRRRLSPLRQTCSSPGRPSRLLV